MQTKRIHLNPNITAALFLLPAFIFIAIFIIYPIFDVAHLSTLEWNGISPDKEFVGLSNWKQMLRDTHFWSAAGHNIFIAVFSILIQMPLALSLAFMLDRLGRKANVLKIIYYLPNLFSTTAVGLLFSFIYNPRNGILTTISKLLGGKTIDVLGNPSLSLIAVFSVICWTAIPYYMIFFLAALSGLPVEIYEASIIDGANLRQYFFSVALPMLKNSIRTACTLSLIGSLKYFDLIWIMTEGGPNYSSDLMATYMYRTTFRSRQMGYGATIAAGMFIIITLFTFVFQHLINRNTEEV
jgi:raffinose/stachyose/melibiose transport system permease protein